jgi:hypothetical protein
MPDQLFTHHIENPLMMISLRICIKNSAGEVNNMGEEETQKTPDTGKTKSPVFW